MLHDGKSKRVAIVGGVRIPFCRANSVYRDSTNQDMMTAVLTGLVQKYDLTDTPLRWEHTRELVEQWDRGEPTPIYRRLGIYK